MKRQVITGLSVLAVIFTALITGSTSARLNTQLEDIVRPELLELSFSPTSIDVSGGSQTVTVTFRLTDELSGVSGACMTIVSPSRQQLRQVCVNPSMLISGNAHDGVYQGSIEFQQLSESGTWRDISLFITDQVGNGRSLGESDLISRGLPTTLQVVGGSDLAPPELVELSFNPTSIDVSGGSQTVTVTFRLTDELSGVSGACMTIVSPSRQQLRQVCVNPSMLISGNAHDGVYQGSIEFQQLSESGTWRDIGLFITDQVGNGRSLGESDLISRGLPATLNVISNPHDVIPPELVELSFNPTSIDVSGGSQTVTVTFRLTDELSGVSGACMTIVSPSRQQLRQVCVNSSMLISGNAHDGVYQGSIEFQQLSESGTWRDIGLFITDQVGNGRSLGESDLISRGLPATLQVIVNHPPVAICQTVIKTAASSCGAIVTPEEVNNGSFDLDGDPLTLSLSPSGPYPVGSTNVVLAVSDNKGGSSQCMAAITIVDNAPPAITCPSSIELIAPMGQNSVVVNYPAPIATDNCSIVTISCSSSSGSSFPVGMTNVVCTATDLSDQTASCSFTVTILTPQAATLAVTTSVNDLVSQGFLTQGAGDSLSFKLEAAITQLDQGNTTVAIRQLNAFINQVNGLIKGGSLTVEQGQTLIHAVNEVMNHVGG